MVSVDTNVLLRWALGDQPKQAQQASGLLEGDNPVHISDAAIIEMGYVLEKVYGLERELVAGYIRAVLSLGQANCNRALFSQVLPIYQDHVALSLTDCCVVVYAELNDATPLYTFDKKLAHQLSAASLPA